MSPAGGAAGCLAADDSAGAVAAVAGLKLPQLVAELLALGFCEVHNQTRAQVLRRFAERAPFYTASEQKRIKRAARVKWLTREIERDANRLARHDEVQAEGGPSFAGLGVWETRAQLVAKLDGYRRELASATNPAGVCDLSPL